MCEFCNLMPNEKGSDNIINSQTFGFFSAAAIEEAVRQANHDNSNINSNDSNEKDEDDEQKPPSGDDGGEDDDSDGT